MGTEDGFLPFPPFLVAASEPVHCVRPFNIWIWSVAIPCLCVGGLEMYETWTDGGASGTTRPVMDFCDSGLWVRSESGSGGWGFCGIIGGMKVSAAFSHGNAQWGQPPVCPYGTAVVVALNWWNQ